MRAILAFLLLTSVSVVSALGTRAEEPVTVSIVIKDHQFEPAEVHAPPGQPIMVRVKNLNSIAAEFESETLHVEKVIPPGGEATMRVRPLEVGRYGFFDDFHRATQGQLIVP